MEMTFNNEFEAMAARPEMFKQFANKLIDNYNLLSSDKLPVYVNLEGFKHYENPIIRLIAKCEHMALDLYSPDSVIPFLKRIVNRGVKMQAEPSGMTGVSEEEGDRYGLGHFRWDWRAYTLSENELNAVRMYLGYSIVSAVNIQPFANAITFKHYQIHSELSASGVSFANELRGDKTHNKFKVSVYDRKSGNSVSFDFFGALTTF